MKTIVIIGAGMMGSALSVPATDNGHRVRVVGTHLDRGIIDHARANHFHPAMQRKLPAQNEYYQIEDLETALAGADMVICGVSSFGVDWFGTHALPRIPASVPVLSVTKGLLDLPDGAMKTFPAVWDEMCGLGHTISAIGGPCTSYELADRHHSAVAFCGPDMEKLRWLKSVMETDYYHVSLSTDVVGVECAVALKNAYALGVSLAIGMSEKATGGEGPLAYNPQAALFGQSVREMGRILALVGGGAENIVYGAGDLYVTVFGGRTRRLGSLLGQGIPFGEAMERLSGVTLESVAIATRTVRAVSALAKAGKADRGQFPLLFHIGRLLDGETGIDIPWKAFEEERA